jgi:hypothetical protein
MTVQATAILLLILRLISLSLVILVLKRQLRLFKLDVDNDLVTFRAVMFGLGIIFFLGHILPIATDIFYGFIHTSDDDFNILVYYAISNCVSGLVASILLWNVYRIAGKALDKQQIKEDKEKGK